MNKVSVIIPVFNGAEWIEVCLRSVLRQSYANLEVIVVDDGSTDKTIEVCQKIQKKDGRILIVRKENGGVSSARNAGLKKSNGKYVFFLDADDYIDKMVIENLVYETMKKNGFVSSMIEMDDDFSKVILERRKEYVKSDFCKDMINSKIQGFCWGFLFETEICRKIMFDEEISYCEDLVFLTSYLEKAKIKKIQFMNKKCGLLHYVQNDNSVTKSKDKMLRNLSSQELALKKFDVITKRKYHTEMLNKKITLCESELQKVDSRKDLKSVMKSYHLPKYVGDNRRYKIFSMMYRHKMVELMLIYYKIRKIAKNLKRRGK